MNPFRLKDKGHRGNHKLLLARNWSFLAKGNSLTQKNIKIETLKADVRQRLDLKSVFKC